MMMLSQISKTLAHILFRDDPCLICTQPSVLALCDTCTRALPYIPKTYCLTCSLPSQGLCTSCEINPPPWSALHTVGWYTQTLRELILRLKYQQQLTIAKALGHLLAHTVSHLKAPDLIVPIPLSVERIRQRGFNQSVEIARAMLRVLDWPADLLSTTSLSRRSGGTSQTMLTSVQRCRNTHNKFMVNNAFQGKNIWLLDDVFTTGATARAAIKTMTANNAIDIKLITIARTPPRYLEDNIFQGHPTDTLPPTRAN